MTKIVSMDNYKRNLKLKNTVGVSNVPKRTSYFVTLTHLKGITRFEFKETFAREVLNKFIDNRQAVQAALTTYYLTFLLNLLSRVKADEGGRALLRTMTHQSLQFVLEATELIHEYEDFEMLMSDESEFLMVMSEVITAILHCTYTAEELQQSIETKDITLSDDPEILLKNIKPFYQQHKRREE